ncbi:MAG TPA: zinc-binding alcohol dehydrogenase family protein [Cyclobacteriaceae bacterium]|nr:zinc-binding alcohol dehydrogenase family protein [Cyclobacteriaceae bacterium]
MKTLICKSPGHFEYTTNATPQEKPGHAILKVRKIGICGTDIHAFEGTQPYFSYPRILGHELAAEIVEVSDEQQQRIVTQNEGAQMKQGDLVTIIPYFNCGQCNACMSGKPNCCVALQVFGVHIDGGMQEHISVPSYSLVPSHGLDEDALALVEPLSVGAHAVGRAGVRANEYVLVIGAGPIGLGTMEFARIAGGHVIALDINQARLDFCRDRLHIAHTINARSENVMDRLKEITNGTMPTVVMDATGSLPAINTGFSYMAHGGRYVLVGLQKEMVSFSHPEFHKREATLMSSRNATRADFEFVRSCLIRKLIDPRTYITHRVSFDNLAGEFPSFLNPANGVIKAMVAMG